MGGPQRSPLPNHGFFQFFPMILLGQGTPSCAQRKEPAPNQELASAFEESLNNLFKIRYLFNRGRVGGGGMTFMKDNLGISLG